MKRGTKEGKKKMREMRDQNKLIIHLILHSRKRVRRERENRLPDFWKVQLNKKRITGKKSKMLEVVLEENRREIIKEWINSGRIKVINDNVISDKEVIFYPGRKEQPGGFKMNKILNILLSEILSMRLEYFYNDPKKLATKDPGMFDFIYNAVRGI